MYTLVYKIDDYADLDHSDGCPLLGVIVVFKSPNGHNLVGDINYYVMPSDTFKQLEKLGLLDEVPPHIGFITAHEGRYSKLRLITKKAATKVTPAVDKYMLAWSAVKGRYINSSVSNKKVNSAAIVECKGFKVRERQI